MSTESYPLITLNPVGARIALKKSVISKTGKGIHMEFKRFKKFISIHDIKGDHHLLNVEDISDVYEEPHSNAETEYRISLRSRWTGPDIEISADTYNAVLLDLTKRYDAVVL